MQSLAAHRGALTCLAHMRAPRSLLSGGADASVLQWGLTSSGVVPTPLRTLGAHAAAVLCCGGGSPLEAGSPLGASGASDGTVALWDARAREACVWRAAAHQDACTGVGIVDGGWVVSCARDGSVAASHIGGGRQRLLRAAGGGPAQRCLQAGAALAYTACFLTCLLAYLLASNSLTCVLSYLLVCMLAYLHTCLPASNPVALACSPTSCVCRPSAAPRSRRAMAAPRTSGTCVPCSSAARCR